jgi:hypothetical protein
MLVLTSLAAEEDPMPTSRSWIRWLRLPSRLALMLGLGAAAVAGVRADTPGDHERTGPGDVLIRSEGGKIFLSEGGRETELRLGATPERDHLLRLLQDHGPAGVKLDPDPRLIMSGGGGSGFSLRDLKNSVIGEPAPAPGNSPRAAPPPSSPKRGSAPRDRDPAADKKG